MKRYIEGGGWSAYRKLRRPKVLDGHEACLAERMRRHRGNPDAPRQDLARERGVEASYSEGCALAGDPKRPLFRTIGRGTRQLTRRALPTSSAHAMIGRRATAAGIATTIATTPSAPR